MGVRLEIQHVHVQANSLFLRKKNTGLKKRATKDMKTIKLTLTSILIGMTVLGTTSKVSGDTKPQVKTDAGITFIDGTATAVESSSNRLLPLGEQTIPSLICAGMILLVLVVLIIYIRKKREVKHETK